MGLKTNVAKKQLSWFAPTAIENPEQNTIISKQNFFSIWS